MDPASNERWLDASIGTILGAASGDSMGSYLEFYSGDNYDKAVLDSFSMPGGGCFKLAPGQVTDDMELGMMLAKGIRDFIILKEKTLDALRSHIASNYIHWRKSEPFDIGNATRAAFSVKYSFMKPMDIGKSVMSSVYSKNANSRSNGFLMRISPMAVWISGVIHEMLERNMINLDKDGHIIINKEFASLMVSIFKVVSVDIMLTHCDNVVRVCGFVYVVIVGTLIATQPNVHLALSMGHAALKCIRNEETKEGISIVSHWMEKGESLRYSNYKKKIGYVKHAFIGSIASLVRGGLPSDIMEDTLHRSGDTDTNACIIMACVGAVKGASGLPSLWKDKLANCSPLRGREEFRPDQFVSLATFIQEHALSISQLQGLVRCT